MDSALAWVGYIANWVGKFFPRWIILDPREGGVKYVRGKRIVKLTSGIHFWWPLVTPEPDVYPVVRQADDLRAQAIVTTDGKTLLVTAMIIYEVTDILLLLPRVFRATEAIKDIALTCVHSVCCELPYTELLIKQQKGTLDTQLKNEAQKALKEYGINVLKVQLIDLAPTRVYKVMQTTSANTP